MKRILLLVIALVLLSGCHAGAIFAPSTDDGISAREAERIATWQYGGMAVEGETVRTSLGEAVKQATFSLEEDSLLRLGHDLNEAAYIVSLVEGDTTPFSPSLTGKYNRGTVLVLVKDSMVKAATFRK